MTKKRNTARRAGARELAALLAALALALGGCGLPIPAEQDTPPARDTGETDTPPGPVQPEPEGYSRADSLFSLLWTPDAPLNPLTGNDVYNEQLFSLIYEGLFSLAPDLTPFGVLCRDWESDDGIVFTLRLRPGVLFHDGTPLTSADVVYSLEAAMASEKYASRLSEIESAAISGELELQIRLSRANFSLPALLDIPIIKSGTASDPEPPGTGPYVRNGSRLDVFTLHRDYTDSALGSLYLRDAGSEDIADAFSERTVDILSYDAAADGGLNIHMVHETRYYETSDLVFLGFNCRGGVTRDMLVRRALMALVNQDAICAESYSGAARRAVFIINSSLGLQDEADEAGYGYSRQAFQRLALAAGLEDRDLDGLLEYSGQRFSLRLLVNSESSARVSAAERIATDMRNMGLDVDLVSVSFSDYLRALENGNFDMYVGEVRLRADLDPGPLLYGELNYGGIDDGAYSGLVDAFLASRGEDRSAAARELNLYVAENAAIVPIAYRQRSVLTHMGVVSNASPSQSGIFNGILGWTFNLSRRDAG